MIYTVTLNPALDKTVEIPSLTVDAVNRITTMRTDPGGKGINVSKVIAKLGGKSIATGILGGGTGRAILSALKDLELTTSFHFVEGETRTNMKIIDPVQHTNTDINEPGVTVSEEILHELLEELLEKLTAKDIVVISGSMPKGSPQDTYYTWTKACREKGAKVILDADGDLLKAGPAPHAPDQPAKRCVFYLPDYLHWRQLLSDPPQRHRSVSFVRPAAFRPLCFRRRPFFHLGRRRAGRYVSFREKGQLLRYSGYGHQPVLRP